MSNLLEPSRHRRQFLKGGLALATLAATSTRLHAQTYPSRFVKILVPFAAGSGTDVVARLIAQELTTRFSERVIVEAQAGSGGNIATAALARSEPDGHTLILTTSAHAIAPSLYKKLPFDIATDFSPISLVCSGPLILTAHPSFAASTIPELVALAKKSPGAINYASPGAGTAPHLAAELLKIRTGIDMVHVPYRGGTPAMTDVLANVVPMYFASPATAMPLVDGGQVKALGQSGAKRPAFVPGIPTIAEQGVTDYQVDFWYGLLAPAKTPREIVARLNAEVVDILKLPKIGELLNKLGFEATSSTPEEFDSFIRREATMWAEVARAANLNVN